MKVLKRFNILTDSGDGAWLSDQRGLDVDAIGASVSANVDHVAQDLMDRIRARLANVSPEDERL